MEVYLLTKIQGEYYFILFSAQCQRDCTRVNSQSSDVVSQYVGTQVNV